MPMVSAKMRRPLLLYFLERRAMAAPTCIDGLKNNRQRDEQQRGHNEY